MTMVRYPSELSPTYGPFRQSIPTDFRVVCLWSALGLTLTALLYAMGFGPEIGQALMAAG